MKNFACHCIAWLTLVLASCQPASEHAALFPQTEALTSKVITPPESEYLIGEPSEAVKVGNRWIVADRKTQEQVHIFDYATWKHLGALHCQGQGPGEFVVAWKLAKDPVSAAHFWVFDIAQRKMMRFHTDSALASMDYRTKVEFTLGENVMAYRPQWLLANRLVSPNMDPGGRLVFANARGMFTAFAGQVPVNEFKGANAAAINERLQAAIVVKPNATQFALVNKRLARIELYDSTGQLLTMGYGPGGEKTPNYKLRNRNGDQILSLEAPEAYTNAAATANYIFAVYSGRTREAYGNRITNGEEVHVFSWDGKPVARWLLDREVFAIAIDEAMGRLLAFSYEPQAAVLAYPLPKGWP